MLTDENSLYFITAKGKAFYAQLMENPYMAEIYPQEESRTALEVFRVSEGTGGSSSTYPLSRFSETPLCWAAMIRKLALPSIRKLCLLHCLLGQNLTVQYLYKRHKPLNSRRIIV